MNAAYRRAKEYFNLQPGWVLHHKDTSLRHNDPDRYNEWRIEDLMPMTKSEHAKYHGTTHNPMYDVHRYGEDAPSYGKVWTDEERKHASEGQYKSYREHPERFAKPEGFMVGEKNSMYGKKQSDECKRKIGIKCKLRAAYKHGELTKEEFEFQYSNV